MVYRGDVRLGWGAEGGRLWCSQAEAGEGWKAAVGTSLRWKPGYSGSRSSHGRGWMLLRDPSRGESQAAVRARLKWEPCYSVGGVGDCNGRAVCRIC